MQLKKRLANEITQQFHGAEAAREADAHFTRVHQEHQAPQDMPDVWFEPIEQSDGRSRVDLGHPLVAAGFIKSNSELKRLVAQGAVEVDGEKIDELSALVNDGSVIKVGRRTFVRVRVK